MLAHFYCESRLMRIVWSYTQIEKAKIKLDSEIIPLRTKYVSKLNISTGIGKRSIILTCRGYNSLQNLFKEDAVLNILS